MLRQASSEHLEGEEKTYQMLRQKSLEAAGTRWHRKLYVCDQHASSLTVTVWCPTETKFNVKWYGDCNLIFDTSQTIKVVWMWAHLQHTGRRIYWTPIQKPGVHGHPWVTTKGKGWTSNLSAHVQCLTTPQPHHDWEKRSKLVWILSCEAGNCPNHYILKQK